MIEFDANKDQFSRHGLFYGLAEQLFDGDFVEREDVRRNYGETRFVATGPPRIA